MNIYERNKLSELILKHFDLSELKELCFWLGIDFETLGGSGKKGMVINLIRLCERQERMYDLLAACRKHHHKGKWPALVRDLNSHADGWGAAPPAPAQGKIAAEPLSHPILIIEDDPNWQDDLTTVLTQRGFAATVQPSYEQAMRFLHHQKPAVIVLDLQLRDQNLNDSEWAGWRLADQAHRRNIPLIVVSGFSSVSILRRSFTQYHVLNFFDKGEFVDEIDQFIFSVTEAIYGAC